MAAVTHEVFTFKACCHFALSEYEAAEKAANDAPESSLKSRVPKLRKS